MPSTPSDRIINKKNIAVKKKVGMGEKSNGIRNIHSVIEEIPFAQNYLF